MDASGAFSFPAGQQKGKITSYQHLGSATIRKAVAQFTRDIHGKLTLLFYSDLVYINNAAQEPGFIIGGDAGRRCAPRRVNLDAACRDLQRAAATSRPDNGMAKVDDNRRLCDSRSDMESIRSGAIAKGDWRALARAKICTNF